MTITQRFLGWLYRVAAFTDMVFAGGAALDMDSITLTIDGQP